MISARIVVLILTVYYLQGCNDIRSTPTTTESSEALTESLPAELQFFNSISGKLAIELTEPPQQMRNLSNLQAPPTAKIKSVRLLARVVDP